MDDHDREIDDQVQRSKEYAYGFINDDTFSRTTLDAVKNIRELLRADGREVSIEERLGALDSTLDEIRSARSIVTVLEAYAMSVEPPVHLVQFILGRYVSVILDLIEQMELFAVSQEIECDAIWRRGAHAIIEQKPMQERDVPDAVVTAWLMGMKRNRPPGHTAN